MPALPGSCRAPPDEHGAAGKVTGAYTPEMTRVACMNACDAQPLCVGYSHSTSYCVIYGHIDMHTANPIDNPTGNGGFVEDDHASAVIGGHNGAENVLLFSF